MNQAAMSVFAQVIPVLMVAIYLSGGRRPSNSTLARIVLLYAVVTTVAVEAVLLLAIAFGLDVLKPDLTWAVLVVAIGHLLALAILAASNIFRIDDSEGQRSE